MCLYDNIFEIKDKFINLIDFIYNLQSYIFKTILDSWLSNTKFYYLLDDIVDSTLKVFTIIRSEMLPIPSKLHYTFNLRDLSKVFQGILMADARKILVSIIFLYSQIKKLIVMCLNEK